MFIISKSIRSRDPQASGAPFTVKHIQRRLIARGYSVGRYGADGVFGSDTDRGVRVFQHREGLHVDGVVGNDTWKLLARSTTTASTAPQSTAARFADLMERWLCKDGLDGSRPAYVFGAENNLAGDKSPDRTDCSEAVQWALYQITKDSWIDGSRNQQGACKPISVAQALKTRGALLFVSGSGSPNGIHHVAMSLGNGKTAEARGKDYGCGSWSAAGRFQYAGLIPLLHY